jgi:hypothetical protein
MLQVQVLKANPEVIEGVSSKTGRPYRIVKQPAMAQLPDGRLLQFAVKPPRDAKPYEPGIYTLGADSFYAKDGSLAFSPKLVAATAAGGTK